jgi:hypothetical protein
MKKLTLVLSFALLSVCAQAQLKSNEIPDPIKSAFKSKFPNAQKVEWEIIDDNTYEANFNLGKQFVSSEFNSSGKWIKTETELSLSDVPAVVSAALQKKIGKVAYEEIEKIETAGGTFYEFQVEKDEMYLSYRVSADGKSIEEIQEEEFEVED